MERLIAPFNFKKMLVVSADQGDIQLSQVIILRSYNFRKIENQCSP